MLTLGQTRSLLTTTNSSARWTLQIVFLVCAVPLAAKASSTDPSYSFAHGLSSTCYRLLWFNHSVTLPALFQHPFTENEFPPAPSFFMGEHTAYIGVTITVLQIPHSTFGMDCTMYCSKQKDGWVGGVFVICRSPPFAVLFPFFFWLGISRTMSVDFALTFGVCFFSSSSNPKYYFHVGGIFTGASVEIDGWMGGGRVGYMDWLAIRR